MIRQRPVIRRKRFLAAALMFLLGGLALTACGDGGGDSGGGSAADDGQREAPEFGRVMTPRSVGTAEYGMTVDEVTALWGEPDKRYRRVVCELGGPNQPKYDHLIWRLPGGPVMISFAGNGETLDAYRVETPRFRTAGGVRVGDRLAALKAAEGDRLTDMEVGVPTKGWGFWKTGSYRKPHQQYEFRNGKLAVISGGNVVLCE